MQEAIHRRRGSREFQFVNFLSYFLKILVESKKFDS